jgi:hypothetical protein
LEIFCWRVRNSSWHAYPALKAYPVFESPRKSGLLVFFDVHKNLYFYSLRVNEKSKICFVKSLNKSLQKFSTIFDKFCRRSAAEATYDFHRLWIRFWTGKTFLYSPKKLDRILGAKNLEKVAQTQLHKNSPYNLLKNP